MATQITPYKFFKNVMQTFRKWVEYRIDEKIQAALVNRPEIFSVTQAQYDALAASNSVNPNAVYMLPEETAAAASIQSDMIPSDMPQALDPEGPTQTSNPTEQ